MRIFTAAAVAMGALALGGVAGFLLAQQYSRYTRMALDSADVARMSTYLMVEQSQGSPQAYETALRDYLVSLDRRDRAGPGFFSRQVAAGDRVLTYMRLSLLAAQRNESDAAALYQSKAELWCRQTGWKSCSPDKLTWLVGRLDQQNPLNPKPAAQQN